jgi:hypothetical protein
VAGGVGGAFRSPVKNSESLPEEKQMANPNVAAAEAAATFGPAICFPSGSRSEIFTGAGVSSRGCQWHFRRGSPGPREVVKKEAGKLGTPGVSTLLLFSICLSIWDQRISNDLYQD